MKISTRGRYAIRFMIDLAEHNNNNFVPLKDIAIRQNISQKYLEIIARDLINFKLLASQNGKNGGYKLIKKPELYNIAEILFITEKELNPVSCFKKNNYNYCKRMNFCKTFPMWENFYKLIIEYFSKITLKDLIDNLLKK